LDWELEWEGMGIEMAENGNGNEVLKWEREWDGSGNKDVGKWE